MPKIDTRKTFGIALANCPVCNRQPKVIVDVEMFNHGINEHVTIKCHRLFRRTHMKVYGSGNSHTAAVIDGIKKWNNLAYCKQHNRRL